MLSGLVSRSAAQSRSGDRRLWLCSPRGRAIVVFGAHLRGMCRWITMAGETGLPGTDRLLLGGFAARGQFARMRLGADGAIVGGCELVTGR
jgi:hypothetical protein